MRNEKGFTLIELLIVVAIIGIIAAIAIPNLLNALDRARQTTTVENIKKLGEYTEQYMMDHTAVGSPKAADIDALQAIFVDTEINKNESITIDGWGNPYFYAADAAMGDRGYTIISYGSDGAEGGGAAPDENGFTSEFPCDIIWINGRFVQMPQGLQKSGE